MRRLLLLLLVALVVGVAVAALGLLLSRGPDAGSAVLGRDRVLTLELAGGLPDYLPQSPFPWAASDEPADLVGIWSDLRAARRDGSVRALAVRIGDLGVGLAKAQELRRQLAAVGDSGRPVECFLETAGEGSNGTLEYYVASACGAISLAPPGELNLLGLYSDGLFLRGTLDKLHIEPSFLTAGRYKSAAEAFTERAHSPAAREAIEAVLDDYFRQIVDDAARGRRLEPAALREVIDRAPLSATRALQEGLVDHVEYADEFRSRIEARVGADVTWQSLGEAYGARRGVGGGGGEIAVVFAQGAILRGVGGVDAWTAERFVGSRSLGQLLDELADDGDVRAVVLRVDSPGGSAVGSDLLHHDVERLARAKPVVVSMSDIAASGGYYLAAPATRVVAEAATLTGSIGVVMGKLATAGFEREWADASRDPIARGAQAGLYRSPEPFRGEGRRRLETRIGEVYGRFLDVVAAGRDLPRAAVERVAEGRIWSGEAALGHRLVDELGGYDAALAAARRLAGLGEEEGAVRFYPRRLGLWEWLAEARPPAFAAEWAQLLGELRALSRPPGMLELPAGWRALTHPF